MTRAEINMALASVLETLDESQDGEAPEGVLALAIEQGIPSSAGRWWEIAAMLLAGGLAERLDGHVMRVTELGREIARKSRALRTEERP